SSSAAIYGQPQTIPIDVNHLKNPLNPYGRSKLFFEEILRDYDQVYGLKSVSLRYFNAAGADLLGRVGERHNPETHLIPLLLQVASGKYKNIKVFGDDYSTKDGTCIRDYIHVVDLCKAHVLALGALLDGQQISKFYNLGSGEGCSVLEVINSVRKVTGKDVGIINAPRRPGDPTVLVADATIAKQELNWHPKYSDLATIVKHAWQWENR
ncbi:MAG: UDP-glucose 4-epimerase GalE, partial [Gammaproteobacteria bacterium]|nr:UDP-glucose 4-epimerase GalE [Gammaproteobacteria bacterium]